MNVAVVKNWFFIGVMANPESFLSLSLMGGLEAEIFRGSFQKFLKLMLLVLVILLGLAFHGTITLKVLL